MPTPHYRRAPGRAISFLLAGGILPTISGMIAILSLQVSNSTRIRPEKWVLLWKRSKFWVEFSLGATNATTTEKDTMQHTGSPVWPYRRGHSHPADDRHIPWQHRGIACVVVGPQTSGLPDSPVLLPVGEHRSHWLGAARAYLVRRTSSSASASFSVRACAQRGGRRGGLTHRPMERHLLVCSVVLGHLRLPTGPYSGKRCTSLVSSLMSSFSSAMAIQGRDDWQSGLLVYAS